MSRNSRSSFSLYRRVIIWLFGYDYFISYSHDDADDYVRDLHHQLSRTHLGFVDSSGEGLFVGSELARDVTKALRRTKVLIIVYTESVGKKRWTKLESRYFKTIHPKRPFIPISASTDKETLRHQLEVVFDSDKDELSEILQAWLKKKDDATDVPTSSDVNPLWAIESDAADLSSTKPSERVVNQIKSAFYGTSVPRKGAYAVSSLLLISCLAVFLGWSQFSSSRGNAILADLSQRMGKANIREIKQADSSEYLLVADIHERNVSDSAKTRGVEFSDEFGDVTDKIRSYDFYRRWGGFSCGYQGVALALYSIPDVVTKPVNAFPATLQEARLAGHKLNKHWLAALHNLNGCNLLAIAFDKIASEQKFVDVLNSLCVHDLRVRKCQDVDLNTLSQLSDDACRSLEAIALSELNGFTIESRQDELELAKFLHRCRHLSVLKMRDLPNCHFSSILAQEISIHPTLCQAGSEIHLERQMLSNDFVITGNGQVRIFGKIPEIDVVEIQEIEQLE